MTDKHVLIADSVSIRRGKKAVLKNLSFSLAACEVMTVIGPNGAGKSTLIAALGGSLKENVTTGSVDLAGQDIYRYSIKEKAQRLAVLSQNTRLDFPFTVAEVVALGRTPHTTGLEIDEKIVFDVCALLELDHMLARCYSQLSGGEQQRVQLARVLAQVWQLNDQSEKKWPRVLLLDEPSTALDLKNQNLLVAAIKTIADQGVAVVAVAHDINLALEYSDKFLCMSEGELVACGNANEVIRAEILEPVFSVSLTLVPCPHKNTPIVTFL